MRVDCTRKNERLIGGVMNKDTRALFTGNSLDLLKSVHDDSVHACVTDPPYGLKFMAKKWDHTVPSVEIWREVYRVLKPGAHLLAFFGTRTYHRGVVNIEDAGFEIRDQIGWLYGTGFPKSLNVSKAIDKAAGAKREVIGAGPFESRRPRPTKETNIPGAEYGFNAGDTITAPATDAAKQWDGWGTALKPAWEPIVVARKPFKGTVAANVLEHGVGGLNIDATRVPHDGTGTWGGKNAGDTRGVYGSFADEAGLPGSTRNDLGRFPANIIHDGSDEVLAEFAKYGERKSGSGNKNTRNSNNPEIYGTYKVGGTGLGTGGDTGTAARFFYCAKASKKERGEGNKHPTVKPLALMRYLVRLVTPPNGVVLDPFAGSGTTLLAAKEEGFGYLGMELSEEYVEIAKDRLGDFV
jgi:DNA modification methylase